MDTSTLFQAGSHDKIYNRMVIVLWKLEGDKFVKLGYWHHAPNTEPEFFADFPTFKYSTKATDDRRGIAKCKYLKERRLHPYDDLPEAYKHIPLVEQTIQEALKG